MIKVYEAGIDQHGQLIKGRLALSARERGDALRFCIRSTGKCYLLIGPNGGRLVINRTLNGRLIHEEHHGKRQNSNGAS